MSDRCGSHLGYRDHERDGTDKCDPCLDGQAAWQRDYEKRRYLAGGNMLVDGTGTRRRLRALAALGWSRAALAGHVGSAQSYTGALMYAKCVHRDTAVRVAAVYDELSMTLGPAPRAAQDAKRKGWPPPLAWDDDTIDDPRARPSRMLVRREPASFDDIAVQRAMRGSDVRLRPAEREEAVRRLTEMGLSTSEIAGRLRLPKRSVTRHRADVRQAMGKAS